MILLRFLWLTFACLSLFATGARAQRVYWTPAEGRMGAGQTNQLSLVFEECTPSGDVTLPSVPDVQFTGPSVSNETSVVNFRTSRRTVLAYGVQPLTKASFTIPTFAVQTDKGRLTVAGVGFEVGDAAVGQTGLPLKDVVFSELRLSRNTIWVGEVVDVEYVLAVSSRFQASISSEPVWKPQGLVLESLGQPEKTERVIGGARWPALRYRTRFMATAAGRFTLDAIVQNVAIQTGERSAFSFFSQPRVEEFAISSTRPDIVVHPLPTPAPAGFSGAVGALVLDSRIVPEKVRVGEPVTWTLSLSGVGNWPANLRLPEREVSADFEVVQPKSQQTIDEGKMFSGSLAEDAVLVPTKPGTFSLGPVRYSFFDTQQGKYVERLIPATKLEVAPVAASRLPAPSPGVTDSAAGSLSATGGAGGAAIAPVPILPGVLPAIAPLPREPILDAATGLAPIVYSPAWWLMVAFLPPMLTWIGLAWREVRRGDTIRARLAARRALVQLLSTAGRRVGPMTPEEIEHWRSLCIAMWNVPRAAPTASDLRAAIEHTRGATNPEVWAELWNDSEDALFRAGKSIDAHWIARALHAVRAARIRRSTPPFPHRWRHWAPAGAAIVLVAFFFLPRATLAASDPMRAYNEGKFAEARAGWQARIVENPRDWSAHNNVALAFAQEEHWSEAAAHWIAAFLLHPRDDGVRANLLLALSRMDGVDPQLRRLVDGGRIDRLATTLSPGEWQGAFFLGAVVSAGGLVMMVAGLYRHRRRLARHAGLAVGITGLVVSIAAMYAETRYGVLAQPEAGMVVHATELKSIPSDLAGKQQTAPLPPGTVVVLGRSFLGWDQVEAGENSAGWIRREVVTPFYHPRRPAVVATGPQTTI